MHTRRKDELVSDRDRWRSAAAAIEQAPERPEERAHAAEPAEGRDAQHRRLAVRDQEWFRPLLTALKDKRRHARRDWTARLRVTIEQSAGSNLGCLETDVRTKDLSRSGFSFIYRQYIPTGSNVTVGDLKAPDAPVLHGTVRRCVHVGGMAHLIGVEFTKASPS